MYDKSRGLSMDEGSTLLLWLLHRPMKIRHYTSQLSMLRHLSEKSEPGFMTYRRWI
ncbi:hypothetical protein TAL182_PE00267 (plasmid) [Rhizobium sp. TAL182]|nr:hypothetical protein TAL182_PE00267 [Rhizobium sp. TAL182]